MNVRRRAETLGVEPQPAWRWVAPYSRDETLPWLNKEDAGGCDGRLECGGSCSLRDGHPGPCLCGGDDIDDGPGTCPA